MHAKEFLHKVLASVIHNKRLNTLSDLTQSLLVNKKLSLTELGRGIESKATERSSIRRSDRFIGNKKVHEESWKIYERQSQLLIGNQVRPRIIVDWTHVSNTKFHAIRAALTKAGRALTLYEEVHPETLLGNPSIERNFLNSLKRMLPKDCKPIIVSDAGFHNDFFKAVINLNWDYVGRIRGLKIYKDGENWLPCKKMMLKATTAPTYMGEFMLSRQNAVKTQFFLVKEKQKNKKRYGIHQTRRGGRDRKNQRLSALEPWLLVSSLRGGSAMNANRVVKIYKTRMQIEEGFRDLKNPRHGFGLRHAYSRDAKRIAVLLLIAMLAILIAFAVGRLVEKKKIHHHFQVNSLKTKRVLSLVFLGIRAIKRRFKFCLTELLLGFLDLRVLNE